MHELHELLQVPSLNEDGRTSWSLLFMSNTEFFICVLQVSLNGPPLQTESCSDLTTKAAKVWRRTHVRNLPPLSNMVLPKVGDCQHTDSLVHTRQMVDCGVQAGPEGMKEGSCTKKSTFLSLL